MEVYWYATAAVGLKSQAGAILFDPFVPLNGADIAAKIEDFDGYTNIFVTHGHFDHISSLPEICKRNPHVRIYCTRTPYKTLRAKGIPKENLVVIQYGQTVFLPGFTVHVLHGKHAHLSPLTFGQLLCMLRSPHRKNLQKILKEHTACKENDETVFYQIDADGKTVSLMGSMNLRDDTPYPTNSDALILPYNGWKDNFPPATATIRRLKPKRILLDHYDSSFPPVTVSIELADVLKAFDGKIEAMEYKQSYTI